jgi:hypothetical protein
MVHAMQGRRLERRIASYRRRGDPGSLGGALDTPAVERLPLGRRAARERGAGEDSPQETFVAASEHGFAAPPRTITP